MDVQIRDAEALRRISPAMLRAYLEARGWFHGRTWRGRILVWSSAAPNGQIREILMPLREESGTYGARIAEVLEALAGWEEQSQLAVYSDLIEAGQTRGSAEPQSH